MANLKPPLKSIEKVSKAAVSTVKTVEKARSNLESSQQRLKLLLEQSMPKTSNTTNLPENNVNSTLNVLQQQFELMNLNQKTMEDNSESIGAPPAT